VTLLQVSSEVRKGGCGEGAGGAQCSCWGGAKGVGGRGEVKSGATKSGGERRGEGGGGVGRKVWGVGEGWWRGRSGVTGNGLRLPPSYV